VASFVVLAISTHGYVFAPQIVLSGGKGVHSYYLFVVSLAGVTAGVIVLSVAAVLAARAAAVAPRGFLRAYLRALQLPIGITVANVVIGLSLPDLWSDLVFNAVRASCAVWAGWILGRRGLSLRKSSAAGLALHVLDHVVIRGGWLLLHLEWLAFGGVLISFAMYAFIPLALGALGGVAAKRFPPSNSTVEPDAREGARGSP
jgi:hypothetical protein